MSPIISLYAVFEPDFKVLSHLMYEYEKGVRNLILYTMPIRLLPIAKSKLDNRGIDFFFLPINNSENINIFFGQKDCLSTIKRILEEKSIEDLSPEEDFILGILLGYDVCRQCQRYEKQKNIETSLMTSQLYKI